MSSELPATNTGHNPALVRWRDISGLVDAIASSVDNDSDLTAARLLSLVDGVLGAHYLLTRLHDHTRPVLAGDRHAENELRLRIMDLARRFPELVSLTDGVLKQEELERGTEAETGCVPSPQQTEGLPDGSIDHAVLVDFVNAVSQAFACTPAVDRVDALRAVFGLVFMTGTASQLLHALRARGVPGVAEQMSWLGALRRGPLSGLPMQTTSGGIPGLPPGTGLPGLPPGVGPGVPKGPGGHPDGGLSGWLHTKIGALVKEHKRWDPEIWDHVPIGVFTPPFVDTAAIRCQIALAWAMLKRQEAPPARPARVVWSDGIAGIETTSPCDGARVTIRGTGFGSPKPVDVGLMVPIRGVCTPLDADPAAWSDTAITFTLPPGVTSGPLGFVDLAYVHVYDAWVDRMNEAAADAIAAAKCAGELRPKVSVMPHFSECPSDTAANHLRAGSAIIRSFTINMAKLTVAEPGDGLSLAWDVVNAEDIRVVRTSATGPLLNGLTTLVNPQAFTSLSLGPATHGGPDRYTYSISATGPCGAVSEQVTVVASKRPRLRIDQVEVTQGIQTVSPSVKLVAQKPTIVRLRVRHGLNGWGANSVPNVTGRMKFQILGSPWSPWYDAINGSNPLAPTPGAAITVPATPQRTNTNDTLNFLIPPAYCQGNVILLAEVRVVGFDVRPPEFAGFSDSVMGGPATSGLYTFEQRHLLDLRYVRVNWAGSTPTDAVCQATLTSSLPLLPTASAVIAPLFSAGVQSVATGSTAARDQLLDDFQDRHDCANFASAAKLLGGDCPLSKGQIWVLIPGTFFRGRAHDIPGDVCFTPPSDGPYAAHELSHCLNQRHLSVACPNGQTASGGDAPSSWPNNGVLTDVPFDSSSNAAVTGATGQVWDVMTYCGTASGVAAGVSSTWPTPKRWQQLWDFNGP